MGKEESVAQRLKSMHQGIETDDVGQKRYLMYHILDEALDEHHSEDMSPEDKVAGLKNSDGYMYKLAQDFLTSSSTLEKQKKLEKILEHLD
jgi:hypothetical protein